MLFLSLSILVIILMMCLVVLFQRLVYPIFCRKWFIKVVTISALSYIGMVETKLSKFWCDTIQIQLLSPMTQYHLRLICYKLTINLACLLRLVFDYPIKKFVIEKCIRGKQIIFFVINRAFIPNRNI